MDEVINDPVCGLALCVSLLVIWVGFGIKMFFSPDFFDGGLGWKWMQRIKEKRNQSDEQREERK